MNFWNQGSFAGTVQPVKLLWNTWHIAIATLHIKHSKNPGKSLLSNDEIFTLNHKASYLITFKDDFSALALPKYELLSSSAKWRSFNKQTIFLVANPDAKYTLIHQKS